MNLLPNARWQINSALGLVAKPTIAGTGAMPAISVSSYTTGATAITANCGSTGELKVGDLLSFSGAHDYLQIATLAVNGMSNSSLSLRLPLGLKAATSAACAAQPVTVGDMAGVTGNGPDGWSKSPELLMWIDDHPENLPAACTRAVGLKKTIDGPQYFYFHVPADKLPMYLGKTFSLAANAKHKVKGGSGTWRLFVNDGATVSYGFTAGTQAYTDTAFSAYISPTATGVDMGIVLDGNAGDVYYFAEPRANLGITANAYWPQQNERLVPTVMQLFATFHDANYTFNQTDAAGHYSFRFTPYADSNGRIAPDVRVINLTWEGRNAATGQAIAMKSAEAAPVVMGMVNYSKVAGAMECLPFEATMGPDGSAYFYSETLNSNIYNSSMEANGFTLN
jgi:hypothetical protein